MLAEMHCPACDGTQVFEQPPCADGHDAECPDWTCVVCGDVICVGVIWTPSARSRKRATARVTDRRRLRAA